MFFHLAHLFLLSFMGSLYAMDNPTGFPALVSAAMKGDTEQVQAFIKSKCDVNVRHDANGMSALMEAALNGYEEVVKHLLAAGANPNLISKFGQTALEFAAYKNPKIFKMLLQAKADPNFQNSLGRTALMREAMSFIVSPAQSYKMALLLNHGADLKLVDKAGKTAADFASSKLVRKLLKKKNNRYEWGQIIVEFEKTDVSDEKPIIRKKPHMTICNLDDLRKACWTGNNDAILEYYKNGGNLNVKYDGNGDVPLLTALDFGHESTFNLLLQLGADPNLQDQWGRTPIFFERCTRQMLETLLALGADFNIQNKEGRTPLMNVFRSCVSLEMYRAALFLQRGAKTDLVDSSGKTVFDYVKHDWQRELLTDVCNCNRDEILARYENK